MNNQKKPMSKKAPPKKKASTAKAMPGTRLARETGTPLSADQRKRLAKYKGNPGMMNEIKKGSKKGSKALKDIMGKGG